MDRGARWAMVHGVSKESDSAEQQREINIHIVKLFSKIKKNKFINLNYSFFFHLFLLVGG